MKPCFPFSRIFALLLPFCLLASAQRLSSNRTQVETARRLNAPALCEGRPGEDFPAILTPRFVAVKQAHFQGNPFVFGYAEGRAAHAYALSLLDEHEIVNDTLGGKPILVSYCSLCNSGVVYGRRVEGHTLTFQVSGKLLHNSQVMSDEETHSLWSHFTGEALAGKLKGTRLTLLASTPRVRWRGWESLHPQTEVLSTDGCEERPFDRYRDYRRNAQEVGFHRPTWVDPRLAPKDMVLGLQIGATSRAYPLSLLRQKTLVQETLARIPLLIVCDSFTERTAVYRCPAPGSFWVAGSEITGQDGGRWSLLNGRSLKPGRPNLSLFPYRLSYWFGWSAFYPETSLFSEH